MFRGVMTITIPLLDKWYQEEFLEDLKIAFSNNPTFKELNAEISFSRYFTK